MAPRKFDNTVWGVWHPERRSEDGWSKPGWEMPSNHSRYIGSQDHQYWDRVLDDARKTYGDPNIRYNTDDPFKERYLVFGDGTRLPSDGTVVYHDGHTKQNFIQNDDGTVQLAGPDGRAMPGTPEAPAAYRRGPDGQVAPINAHGQQVGPLMGDVPKDKGQAYYDNGRGVLTPTNARGDYYTLDDNGNRHYFDRSGQPISKEQYDSTPADPGSPPPGGGDGLSTDEENSGRAAAAVGKVKSDAERRNSNLHEADAKLAELMLSAHASSADGRAALEGMQQDIISALNDPNSNLDTPAGELQFLKLLRDKAGAASDLVKSGKLTDADRAKMAEALADFYRQGANGTSNQPGDQALQQPGDPNPGLTPGFPLQPSLADPGPGLGPQPGMPDPSLGDLGLGASGLGPGSPMDDMLSSAAPLIPSVLSGLGSPLSGSGLGGGPDLGAVTKPISDAIQAASDHGHKDDDKPVTQPDGKPNDKPAGQPGDTPAAASTPTNPSQQQPPAPTPAPGTVPDHALTPPPTPGQTTVVDLKDGSSVTATDPSRAGAVRSALTGTAVGEAYRLNNLAAPPPGTTLTNYIPPDQLQPGDYAMYHDKLIMVLGPDKFVGEDGQVQPLKQLPQGADFLGFGRPSVLTPPSATVPPPTPPTPGTASLPQ
ncbi:DUF4226 domain-containing protein [Mycobacterium haemophilum]